MTDKTTRRWWIIGPDYDTPEASPRYDRAGSRPAALRHARALADAHPGDAFYVLVGADPNTDADMVARVRRVPDSYRIIDLI